MNMELLFKNKKLVGKNILNIIRDNGYTKLSFSKLIKIPNSTLDKLIEGDINNYSEFKIYINKILKNLNINIEQLICYIPKYKTNNHYNLDNNDKKIINILEDIIHMYELYYN